MTKTKHFQAIFFISCIFWFKKCLIKEMVQTVIGLINDCAASVPENRDFFRTGGRMTYGSK
jgi:hypothetical protein